MSDRRRGDWHDLVIAVVAAVVCVLCVIGAVRYMERGDKAVGVLLCVLCLVVAIPALAMSIRKFREGDR